MAMVLFGCGTKPYQLSRTKVKHISERNYVIGETKRARVGDIVISVSDYNQSIVDLGEMRATNSFRVDDEFFQSGNVFSITGVIKVDGKEYNELRIRGYRPHLFADNNGGLLDQNMMLIIV